ncbi:MAG: hypothetical protein ACLQIQ_13735 [Beijerinckiaceae bacterium]
MKALYSFIIDADPRFEIQARIFLTTIIAAGVSSADIICRHTPSATLQARAVVDTFGVELLPIAPFLDGRHCNKIGQLPALIERDADFLILCDTDLAFLDPLTTLFDTEHVRAKQVDRPIPPLAVLNALREQFCCEKTPRLVPVSIGDELTYSVNCNGGLYIIPRQLAALISRAWRAEAERLCAYRAVYEGWFSHTDQISFAMTMLANDLDVAELPIEYNFPLHLYKRFGSRDFRVPRVLHYHRMVDNQSRLLPVGHPAVDLAVNHVNDVLERNAKYSNWTKLPRP